jgi:hypothetical protein
MGRTTRLVSHITVDRKAENSVEIWESSKCSSWEKPMTDW